MKFYLILLIAIQCTQFITAACPKNPIELLFLEFLSKYGFSFPDPVEYARRLQIFSDNLDLIKNINSDPTLTYKAGINEFSALTSDEFLASYTGANVEEECNPANSISERKKRQGGIQINFVSNPLSWSRLPSSVDWRQQGYVTPVQQQGRCNSCWAFAATGSLEGQHFKKTGRLVKFSDQNLVDCVYGSYGTCNTGTYWDAWRYINQNGINIDELYPYISANSTGGMCKYNSNLNVQTNLASYTKVTPNDEQIMKEALAKTGPIATALDSRYLQVYRSGIFNGYPNYACIKPNHAVLLVGYGSDSADGDFWTVKNSWGLSFGEDGYFRIARNKRNLCGIASYGFFPNLN